MYLKNHDMLNLLHEIRKFYMSKDPFQPNFKFLVTREKTYLYKKEVFMNHETASDLNEGL